MLQSKLAAKSVVQAMIRVEIGLGDSKQISASADLAKGIVSDPDSKIVIDAIRDKRTQLAAERAALLKATVASLQENSLLVASQLSVHMKELDLKAASALASSSKSPPATPGVSASAAIAGAIRDMQAEEAADNAALNASNFKVAVNNASASATATAVGAAAALAVAPVPPSSPVVLLDLGQPDGDVMTAPSPSPARSSSSQSAETSNNIPSPSPSAAISSNNIPSPSPSAAISSNNIPSPSPSAAISSTSQQSATTAVSNNTESLPPGLNRTVVNQTTLNVAKAVAEARKVDPLKASVILY